MSDRERWTIYPLLFLALALSLRDRVFPPRPTALSARQLTIVGEDGRPNILLRGSDEAGGASVIELLNAEGNTAWIVVAGPGGSGIETTGALLAREIRVLGPDGRARLGMGSGPVEHASGRIEWFNADEELIMAAGGSDTEGGGLTTFRPGKLPQVSFGSNANGSVIVARNAEGIPSVVLLCDETGVGRCLVTDGEGNVQLLVGRPVDFRIGEVEQQPSTESEKQPPTDQPSGEPEAPRSEKPAEPSAGEPTEQPDASPAADEAADSAKRQDG